MADEKKGITVTGVDVENFHRLKFARARLIPGQGLVRVTGKNGSGKTSLLRSIRAALGGAGEILPEALHEGAEGGTVRLELSNGFTIARKFTPAQPKGYLTVLGADGGKHSQGKLDEWLGSLSFDPLAFFELKAERQREILLSLGGDPQLPTKLDGIRRRRAAKYDERTPWIATKRRAAQVAKPAGERPELVDVSAELRRMGELQKAERTRADMIREHDRQVELATRQAEDKLREARSLVEGAQADLEDARLELQQAQAQVVDLEQRLANARERQALAGQTVLDQEAALARAAEALDQVPTVDLSIGPAVPLPADLPEDPTPAMEEVRARIAAADQAHQALRPWEAFEEARAEQAEATQAIDGINAEMEALDQQEKELVASAGIPVPGLGFAEGGEVTLNGRPLEVASGAERIRLAVAVALAANPELRICLVDEANDIDLEGIAELDTLAKAHGFQVWCARLGLEGPGEIVVVDGEAHARDGEPAVALVP